jgi:hypothetical protein
MVKKIKGLKTKYINANHGGRKGADYNNAELNLAEGKGPQTET